MVLLTKGELGAKMIINKGEAMSERYKLTVTEEQLKALYDALHVGTPITLACSIAGITTSMYYLWVEIASIVEYAKEQDFLAEQKKEYGNILDLDGMREDMSEENESTEHFKSSIKAFKQPKGSALLKYRNDNEFHEYADKIYEIIRNCDKNRTEIVMYHLSSIRDAARKKGGNAQSSQWFLERTLPQYFGKKDPNVNKEDTEKKTASIQIEYVNPRDKDSIDRVREMEEMLEKQIHGDGAA